MKSIYRNILDQRYNSPLVLATVTGTNGSTPQKPGSSALFCCNGLICGTVGGGIVENRVEKIALEAIKSGKSGLYSFNLANEISNKEEAICGGEISILVDARLDNYTDLFEKIDESLVKNISGVLATMVTKRTDMVHVSRYWISESFVSVLPDFLHKEIEPVVKEMMKRGKSSDYRELTLTAQEKDTDVRLFLEPVFPPEKLIIAGAGHIGRALAHLGSMLNFEVTVIDDRPEYANSLNIPDADYILVKNIGEAVKKIEKDDSTYIVIVTRGHRDDAEALKNCIGDKTAYIGMIGSRNKVATIREELLGNGYATKEQWERIHAPVGIDIKSQTVEEIAVSIAAQLVLVRNRNYR